MELPVRKHTRIPGYDYSTNNYYFITICTDDKKCIFGKLNGLNSLGLAAKKCIFQITEKYPQATVDKYVIMPNHIHMILVLEYGERQKNSTISQIVGQYKMSVTKLIHAMGFCEKVWQRSFHDHIIRDQKGYEKIWLYIENNPIKWEEDCFYQRQLID